MKDILKKLESIRLELSNKDEPRLLDLIDRSIDHIIWSEYEIRNLNKPSHFCKDKIIDRDNVSSKLIGKSREYVDGDGMEFIKNNISPISTIRIVDNQVTYPEISIDYDRLNIRIENDIVSFVYFG